MKIAVSLFVLFAHVAVVSSWEYSYCTNYADYNTLANLIKHDKCLNVDSVFKLLTTVSTYAVSCRVHIIDLLAGHFGSHASTPHHCRCHGVNKLQAYHIGPGDGVSDIRTTCLQHSAYQDMYYQFFTSSHTTSHALPCRTHHSVWSTLRNISSRGFGGGSSCQKDIIFHLKYAFERHTDNCICEEFTTRPPTTRSTTSAPTPTTTVPTTTIITVSTKPTSPPTKFTCSEVAAVTKIAKAVQVRHPDASPCVANAGGSDDAYVLSSCNMTSPMTWRKGASVMTDCESNTHLVPGFSPISTFTGQSYSSLGSQPGIFLECYKNGFKMALQKCNGVPEIVHIENGPFLNNPRNYFVIA